MKARSPPGFAFARPSVLSRTGMDACIGQDERRPRTISWGRDASITIVWLRKKEKARLLPGLAGFSSGPGPTDVFKVDRVLSCNQW
tara:strand:- start:7139 stop:7396 length:258 start_codon:yes stop_codon:yes gene_type:complete